MVLLVKLLSKTAFRSSCVNACLRMMQDSEDRLLKLFCHACGPSPSLHTGLIFVSSVEGLASLSASTLERFQHIPSPTRRPEAPFLQEAVSHHGRKEPRHLRTGETARLLSQMFSYSQQGTSL